MRPHSYTYIVALMHTVFQSTDKSINDALIDSFNYAFMFLSISFSSRIPFHPIPLHLSFIHSFKHSFFHSWLLQVHSFIQIHSFGYASIHPSIHPSIQPCTLACTLASRAAGVWLEFARDATWIFVDMLYWLSAGSSVHGRSMVVAISFRGRCT